MKQITYVRLILVEGAESAAQAAFLPSAFSPIYWWNKTIELVIKFVRDQNSVSG